MRWRRLVQSWSLLFNLLVKAGWSAVFPHDNYAKKYISDNFPDRPMRGVHCCNGVGSVVGCCASPCFWYRRRVLGNDGSGRHLSAVARGGEVVLVVGEWYVDFSDVGATSVHGRS